MADPDSPNAAPDSQPPEGAEAAPQPSPEGQPPATAATGDQLSQAEAAAPAASPEPLSEGEAAAAGVEFVGGPAIDQRRGIFSRRLPLVAGLVLAAALLLAAGWFASRFLPETLGAALGGDSREPRTTRLFTQALARHDPAGMRAQVTSKCVADQNSSLCFGPEFDNQFQTFVKDRTITPTFLRQFKGHLGRFVVYDLYLRLRTTGQQDEIMLTFRLAKDGKIDQILTS
jgi:hypothetical protein